MKIDKLKKLIAELESEAKETCFLDGTDELIEATQINSIVLERLTVRPRPGIPPARGWRATAHMGDKVLEGEARLLPGRALLSLVEVIVRRHVG